jgi:hypothetical protein
MIIEKNNNITADPEKFREQRVVYEKKLNDGRDSFLKDIRESRVVQPDLPGLRTTYIQRWHQDCEIAERRYGLKLERDAMQKEIDAAFEHIQFQRLFKGPIAPEALERAGFRPWSDGSFRTEEMQVRQVGKDWHLKISRPLIGEYTMLTLVRLKEVLGWASVTPLHQPASILAGIIRWWNRRGTV